MISKIPPSLVAHPPALDSVFTVRDPFQPFVPEWFTSVPQNTRVMLFAQNLRLNPGELSSAVFVRLTLNNSVILQMPAEDVRALRESEFTQVVFRLPTGLRPGTYTRANPRTHTSQQRGHDPDRAVEEKGSGDNYSGFHELAVALLSAVAAHLLCTKDEDATGLSRGMSRSLLSAGLKAEIGCHGLVPWRLTLEAK